MHVALLVLALAAVDQATSPPPSPNPADQQVERVRAALERPPSRLTVPEVHADFRVHIEVRRPLQDIFDKPLWQLPPAWHPPAVGFDVGSLLMSAAHGIAEVKRGHDLRVAQDEVWRAIVEYCAAQPNSATISICSTSASAR